MTLNTFSPSAASTVTRTLVLAEPANDLQIARLSELEGVIQVTPSPDHKRLDVTYDVRGTVMEALEKVVFSLGLKLSLGLVARLGRKWFAFQDENMRTQAKLEHHCCNSLRK